MNGTSQIAIGRGSGMAVKGWVAPVSLHDSRRVKALAI